MAYCIATGKASLYGLISDKVLEIFLKRKKVRCVTVCQRKLNSFRPKQTKHIKIAAIASWKDRGWN